jgi:hypothetical protein
MKASAHGIAIERVEEEGLDVVLPGINIGPCHV